MLTIRESSLRSKADFIGPRIAREAGDVHHSRGIGLCCEIACATDIEGGLGDHTIRSGDIHRAQLKIGAISGRRRSVTNDLKEEEKVSIIQK